MSVTAVPLRPLEKGTIPKFWIGILLVLLLGAGLAWLGTARQQFVTTDQGVRYRAFSAGSGEVAGPDDLMQVHFELRGPDGDVLQSTERTMDPRTGRLGSPQPASTEELPPSLAILKEQLREGSIHQVIGSASQLLGPQLPPDFEAGDQVELRLRVVGIERGGVTRLRQRIMQEQMMQQQMMQEMGGVGRPGAPAPAPQPGGR